MEIRVSKFLYSGKLPPRAGEKDINLVQQWLALELNTAWLMVIDSADNLERFDCKELIPQCKHRHIIVTTTQSWAAKISSISSVQGIEVRGLDLAAASEMFLLNVDPTQDCDRGKLIPSFCCVNINRFQIP